MTLVQSMFTNRKGQQRDGSVGGAVITSNGHVKCDGCGRFAAEYVTDMVPDYSRTKEEYWDYCNKCKGPA